MISVHRTRPEVVSREKEPYVKTTRYVEGIGEHSPNKRPEIAEHPTSMTMKPVIAASSTVPSGKES